MLRHVKMSAINFVTIVKLSYLSTSIPLIEIERRDHIKMLYNLLFEQRLGLVLDMTDHGVLDSPPVSREAGRYPAG